MEAIRRRVERWLRTDVGAMALGHVVPARPEDPGRLAHHPEEEGVLFGPFKESGRGRTRFPQATEGGAKGDA